MTLSQLKMEVTNYWMYINPSPLNSLRPRPNGRHFADDIFKRIFLNENGGISIKISLKFVHKGPINNTPALVQMMAWRRLGDKPLSESMMVSLSMLISVTRPQWVNTTYIYHWAVSLLVLDDGMSPIWPKQLSEPMLTSHHSCTKGTEFHEKYWKEPIFIDEIALEFVINNFDIILIKERWVELIFLKGAVSFIS